MINLRRWLARPPVPAKIYAVTGGDKTEIAIPSTSRGRWETVENAIAMQDPEFLQLEDKNGAIIRVQRMKDEIDAETSEAKEKKNKLINLSDVAGLVDRIADRFNEAHDAGARAVNEAMATSQAHMVMLVEFLCQRLVGIESKYEKLAMKYGEDLAESEGGLDDSTKLVLQTLAPVVLAGLAKKDSPSANNSGKKE